MTGKSVDWNPSVSIADTFPFREGKEGKWVPVGLCGGRGGGEPRKCPTKSEHFPIVWRSHTIDLCTASQAQVRLAAAPTAHLKEKAELSLHAPSPHSPLRRKQKSEAFLPRDCALGIVICKLKKAFCIKKGRQHKLPTKPFI